MNRSKIDLGVGVFVVIGIGALLFLALKVGNLGRDEIRDPYVLTARFDNIGGLKARAPVKASGVLVGRIVKIHYDSERFQAEVKMQIDGRYRFPKDTFATINTSGLLGEQYIGLEPGGDEANLNGGDTIAKTQSAVVLEKLISRFMFDKAAESGSDK
ncbi:outer membrane lipid asymmetry maintenance protein MlaD [Niveibacterium sp. SC-1]|uniref:outer membrane lipid asymmetry maintenance protein MlaD n=1 Tax=Niveibacterium sp. SC-1 TaxID=3135646 RepID=UPI00311E5223